MKVWDGEVLPGDGTRHSCYGSGEEEHIEDAIVVGSKQEVYGDELIASELNWITIVKPKQPITVRAKIRYLHQETEAAITPLGEDRVYVKFNELQMAITPGQVIVFYDEDAVISGGMIEQVEK